MGVLHSIAYYFQILFGSIQNFNMAEVLKYQVRSYNNSYKRAPRHESYSHSKLIPLQMASNCSLSLVVWTEIIFWN